MHLVEVFLPLNTNAGKPLPVEFFRRVREQLAEQFGGVTAFTRSRRKGYRCLKTMRGQRMTSSFMRSWLKRLIGFGGKATSVIL